MAEALESRRLLAGVPTPILVQDVDQTTDMLAPANAVQVGNVAFFSGRPNVADDYELFKTDGTTGGTVLVKDINPGAAGSTPASLTGVGSALYFSATDGANGQELWKSDGTVSGTMMVLDLNPGLANSSPTNLTNVGGTLYFTATDGSGVALWKTDGTANGTVRVTDASAGSAFTNPKNLVAFGNTLLFTATKSSSSTLFAATGSVAAPVTTGINSPSNLTAFNGAIYFSSCSGNTFTLYRTDGTAGGTVVIKSATYSFAIARAFCVSGNTLYFTVGSIINGTNDLWRSDGTTGGTFATLADGKFTSYDVFVPVGTNSIVFPHTSGAAGSEPWISDGTVAGTKLLKDLAPGTADGSIGISGYRLSNGNVVFASPAGSGDGSIWKTDGTLNGTVKVAALAVPNIPIAIGMLNDVVLFNGALSLSDGDLFRSDGTAGGTYRVGATLPTNGSGLLGSPTASLNASFAVGSTVYFDATDGFSGNELWRTTGSGAQRVADLSPGSTGSDPSDFIAAADGSFYFTASPTIFGHRQLYRIAPGGSVPQAISITLPDATYQPRNLHVAGNILYFSLTNGAAPILWRYDPSSNVSTKVVVGGNELRFPSSTVQAGAFWYFGAQSSQATPGQQLYRVDGTVAAPQLVSDLSPGTSATPSPIAAIGSLLIFERYSTSTGWELWKSDGTAGGTGLLVDLDPGNSLGSNFNYSTPHSSAVASGVLYLSFYDSNASAYRVARTDGTPGGTYLMGGTVIGGQQIASLNGKAVFVGSDANGSGLFQTDGDDTDGPARLTDIGIGGAGATISALHAAGGRIYFWAYTGTTQKQFELWRTTDMPGTAEQIAILALKPTFVANNALTSLYANGLFALESTATDLYFPKYATATGLELYRIPLTDPASISGRVFDDSDADGLLGSEESYITGDTLYIDANNNGSFDNGEVTNIVDATGYHFNNLSAGTYVVRRKPTQDGRRVTTPANGAITITIAAGQDAVLADIGTTALPPTASTGGPYTVNEGKGITVDGTASSELLGSITKYEWDYNYNGQIFDIDATGVKPTFSAGNIDGPSSRTIALRVTDSNGLTNIASTTVAITNANPTATFSGGGAVAIGAASTVSFTNPVDYSADVTAGFLYSFDFNNDGDFADTGDVANSASSSATFSFPAASTYTVHGRITDKDGGFSDYTTQVIVNPTVPPPPPPPPPPADPTTVLIQAEAGTLGGGTSKSTANAGSVGGYADYGGQNSSVAWNLTRNGAGAVSLDFRYANGGTTNRPLSIVVNGVAIGTIQFIPTGSWTTWKSSSIAANLKAGVNTIQAIASTSVGGANVDSLTVTIPGTPPPPPPPPPPPGTASLSGSVFDDADKTGTFTAGDTQPTGRRVFLDLNGNNTYDSATEASVLTGAGGTFSFGNLNAGTYHVREVLPANTAYSTTLIDQVLSAGQSVSNLVIGVKPNPVPPPPPPPPPPGAGSISGTAFNDNNSNAKYDSGDGASKGITVFLDTNNNGKLDGGETSITTDASTGKFTFSGLGAGTYRVRRVFPTPGYTYSTVPIDVTLTAGQVKTGTSLGTKKG